MLDPACGEVKVVEPCASGLREDEDYGKDGSAESCLTFRCYLS